MGNDVGPKWDQSGGREAGGFHTLQQVYARETTGGVAIPTCPSGSQFCTWNSLLRKSVRACLSVTLDACWGV